MLHYHQLLSLINRHIASGSENVEGLALALQLKVFYANLDSHISGILEPYRGTHRIIINEGLDRSTRDCVIAQFIAHYILHYGRIKDGICMDTTLRSAPCHLNGIQNFYIGVKETEAARELAERILNGRTPLTNSNTTDNSSVSTEDENGELANMDDIFDDLRTTLAGDVDIVECDPDIIRELLRQRDVLVAIVRDKGWM